MDSTSNNSLPVESRIESSDIAVVPLPPDSGYFSPIESSNIFDFEANDDEIVISTSTPIRGQRSEQSDEASLRLDHTQGSVFTRRAERLRRRSDPLPRASCVINSIGGGQLVRAMSEQDRLDNNWSGDDSGSPPPSEEQSTTGAVATAGQVAQCSSSINDSTRPVAVVRPAIRHDQAAMAPPEVNNNGLNGAAAEIGRRLQIMADDFDLNLPGQFQVQVHRRARVVRREADGFDDGFLEAARAIARALLEVAQQFDMVRYGFMLRELAERFEMPMGVYERFRMAIRRRVPRIRIGIRIARNEELMFGIRMEQRRLIVVIGEGVLENVLHWAFDYLRFF